MECTLLALVLYCYLTQSSRRYAESFVHYTSFAFLCELCATALKQEKR